MLKIGLFGVGHLGEIHLKCIKNIGALSLVGFYDPDKEKSKKIADQYKIQQFSDPATLMDAVDVVDIVSPTTVSYTHLTLPTICSV